MRLWRSVAVWSAICQKAASKIEKKKQTLGNWGEDVATNYLRSLGYKIVARHWTARAAEIDIIAKEGDEFVFVEVKTRSSRFFGLPEESIYGHKVHRLIRAVELYRAKNRIVDKPYRIDAVAIERDPIDGTHELRHLKHIL